MCKSERRSASVCLLFLFIFLFFGTLHALETVPYIYGHKNYGSELQEPDPEMMFAILTRLGQTILRANDAKSCEKCVERAEDKSGRFLEFPAYSLIESSDSSKRGLDLGLSRGYSGSQQAKHMMGIAAAGLSGGPGRRRRSQDTYRYGLPN